MPIDLMALLKKHLDGDFKVYMNDQEPPSLADLEKFEKEHSCTLPDDFKKYSISKCGGLILEVKEEVWPPAKAYDILPAWKLMRGISFYGFSSELPEQANIHIQTKEYKAKTEMDLIPFMKIYGDPSRFCFTLEGKIVLCEHGSYELIPQTESLAELFDSELSELRKRKDRQVQENAQK